MTARLLAAMVAVVLSGCATNYVPVEIKTKRPGAPAACKSGLERAPRMTKFGNLRQWSVVEINGRWVQHDLDRDAVERRNEQRWQVCRVWINHIERLSSQ